MFRKPLLCSAIVLFASLSAFCGAVGGSADAQELAPDSGLVLSPVGRGGRTPFKTNPVEYAFATGEWSAPVAGDPVVEGNDPTWRDIVADDDGWFRADELRGGYLAIPVESDHEQIMLLEVDGAYLSLRVNGEPRASNPYGTGWIRLPVLLHEGTNEFLFRVRSGQLRMRLNEPAAPLILDHRDSTMPQLLIGEDEPVWGALLLINATNEMQDGLQLVAKIGSDSSATTALAPISPLTIKKVGFQIKHHAIEAGEPGGASTITLHLENARGEIAWTEEFELPHIDPAGSHHRTFVSQIDGSVQYYAVQPASNPPPLRAGESEHEKPGLILTLHGASVEATNQRNQYTPRDWAYVIAPTNRRPFGFDWEDWGRLDALEVLDEARRVFATDVRKTWITGHSMGGHGAWAIGTLYPGTFAAVGPSAGWISFTSYSGAQSFENASPVEAMFRRAASVSDTLARHDNLKQQGVYILHGDRDDNVPVTEARRMVKELAEFHQDFAYHEQRGAGHWWGSLCCDWPPMMEFFQRFTLAEVPRDVEFVTPNPAVSAKCHWVRIVSQEHSLKPSRIKLNWNPGELKISGTTENVSVIRFDTHTLMSGTGTLAVELDGQSLVVDVDAVPNGAHLQRVNDNWKIVGIPSRGDKGSHRAGPFKEAFARDAVLVYGTRGTVEENAWSYAKARYDAETFWYRGNGAFDVLADEEFIAADHANRNVILYGNSDTNAAWDEVLGEECPVRFERDNIVFGDRILKNQSLGGLFVFPRKESEDHLIGVVTGSDLTGMRLTDTLPYFVSGVHYPDACVFDASILQRGIGGVVVAGFFGNDWTISAGDFAWRDDQ